MCLRSISLLSKLVVTLALRSSSQTASQDATIDSYLELHADYLKTLDAEDASIISNVAEVERTSTRPILYHACTVYIAFLAALYDSLLFDRPLSFFLSGNMSYAVANLTWRVFQGAAKLPSVPEPNNLTERSLGAATLSSFLKRAEDTGLLNGNFDHVVGVRERLLAANVNAFGGKTLGENTWTYRFVATWWTPMGISGFVSFLDEIFEAMNSSQEVRQKVTKQVSAMGCLLNQQQAVRASDCLAEDNKM
ncbi:unnamed protein product [Durusdinium trenchii]|uniref:Uncharacterized protein n=2 Tax=Durusdinium trenchii TaxID=1381693 RepID=A0ABP0MWL9_9DINO